jgi:hypothetical protein
MRLGPYFWHSLSICLRKLRYVERKAFMDDTYW